MTSKNHRSDAELQQAVLNELRWDTRVDETDVGVEVSNAIVTLTGSVSSWAKRNAAQEAAHRVAGVLDVANDIKVQRRGVDAPTDTDIAKAIRRTLEWDVFVPDERVRSTVSNGWVTLVGSVDTWAQREATELAVRNLRGVVGITNELSVAPPAIVACELQEAIAGALERRAERGARRIDVDLVDDRVILSGIVHSWPEKQAVLGAVKGTVGVGTVDDRLQVAPFSA